MRDYESTDLAGAAHLARDDVYDDREQYEPELLICPSCGKDAKYLEEHTGFCQTCTNEHRRGSGPTHK